MVKVEPLRIPVFEEAEIGTSVESVTCDECVAYDYYKCLVILTNNSQMSMDEAEEHMNDVYLSRFLNSDTPLFIKTKRLTGE